MIVWSVELLYDPLFGLTVTGRTLLIAQEVIEFGILNLLFVNRVPCMHSQSQGYNFSVTCSAPYERLSFLFLAKVIETWHALSILIINCLIYHHYIIQFWLVYSLLFSHENLSTPLIDCKNEHPHQCRHLICKHVYAEFHEWLSDKIQIDQENPTCTVLFVLFSVFHF